MFRPMVPLNPGTAVHCIVRNDLNNHGHVVTSKEPILNVESPVSDRVLAWESKGFGENSWYSCQSFLITA